MKGIISIFSGNDETGNEDGVGTSARFNNLSGVTIDQQTGNLFVSDGCDNIRKITPQGNPMTFLKMKFSFHFVF
jgi:hypothetical protein